MRLLDFPFLIFIGVVKLLEPSEMYLISRLSQRVKNNTQPVARRCKLTFDFCYKMSTFIKMSRRVNSTEEAPKSNYKIEICIALLPEKLREANADVFGHLLQLQINDDHSLFKLDFGMTETLCSYKAVDGKCVLEIAWQDVSNGLQVVYEELKNLFEPQLGPFEFHVDVGGINENQFAWLNECDFPLIIFKCTEETKLQYEYVLDYVQTEGRVNLHMNPVENFSMDDFDLKMNALDISSASWVTPTNMTQMNCKAVKLKTALRITDRDINKYLKAIIKGANPELEYLELAGRRAVDEAVLVQGINATPISLDNVQHYSNYCFSKSDSGGKRFSLANGQFGSVVVERARLSTIYIFIWRAKLNNAVENQEEDQHE